MQTAEITDELFRKAVEAIDAGRIDDLKNLITEHPRLIKEPLLNGEEGYFKNPYLIYFIADNPIRNAALASNIIAITRLLIEAIKSNAADSSQLQVDYTFGLVVTGKIPKESGVQIELMDVLLEAGAVPGNALGALAHGNIEAAAYLLKRAGELHLSTAVGLGYSKEEISRLVAEADEEEKLVALTVAAFYGNEGMILFLLANGANPNGYPKKEKGFHSHATPLHQAISSGSLKSVQQLVEAGADLNCIDKIYSGTPLGWAQHMQVETKEGGLSEKYKQIEIYLLSKKAN